MQIHRPWLLVVLPALASLLAFFGVVLWKVGENVHDLGRPAAIGAVIGLIVAGLLTVRRSGPRPP